MDTAIREEIKIPVGHVEIMGNLVVSPGAGGIVIFSHGSGSSRFSPRNNFVAAELNKEGMATLLTDLLTPEEDSYYDTASILSCSPVVSSPSRNTSCKLPGAGI